MKRPITGHASPALPQWIRNFAHPGYVNVYSLKGLMDEPRLYCTESLFGDWTGRTLLLAKDAAPAWVIRQRISDGDPEPWRHGVRGVDPMGYSTNERVAEIGSLIDDGKLYGSVLAHLLKEDERTSGTLRDLNSGPLHEHIRRVLEFVVNRMTNLVAIVALGREAHRLVASLVADSSLGSMRVGEAVPIELYGRTTLVARLHHPSRPFAGGWTSRREEWNVVAGRINEQIRDARRLEA